MIVPAPVADTRCLSFQGGPILQVLCLLIEHLATAVEQKDNPELASRVVVIGGSAHERKPVFDCSREAGGFGIKPGLSLREAAHLCPDAVFLPMDEAKYTCAFDRVLDVLEHFSPVVESECLGTAFLDISGCEGLFGSYEELAGRLCWQVSCDSGLFASIGIATSKLVAGIAASRALPGAPLIVERGREREFLQPLPVDLLPLSEETKRRLGLLALRTMGQVAALPRDALVAQFGPEGLLAHEWAGGVDERPLTPRAKPAVLEEERCCDTPVDTLDGLVARVGDLLDRLVPRLKERNQVCRQVRLRLDFDDGGSSLAVFTLKAAADSKGEMLGYLKRRLDGTYLPSAVTGIGLGLTGLGPGESVQGSLAFHGDGEHRQRARQLVGNLRLRWGTNPLKVVAPLDPASRIPERRARLIDFEP